VPYLGYPQRFPNQSGGKEANSEYDHMSFETFSKTLCRGQLSSYPRYGTDRNVVATAVTGTATDKQYKRESCLFFVIALLLIPAVRQNAVEVHSFRAYHDMSAMLRVMQFLDPEEYAKVSNVCETAVMHAAHTPRFSFFQVPEIFKTGSNISASVMQDPPPRPMTKSKAGGWTLLHILTTLWMPPCIGAFCFIGFFFHCGRSRRWPSYVSMVNSAVQNVLTSKRNRTYAVRVKGVYSGVPGLQDLIGMENHTFGGFWNMPRPWENPHCQMTKELRLRLPRLLFYHEDLGWLNHETYYEAAMQMYIDEAYVEGGRGMDSGSNQNPLLEAKRIKNNVRHVAYRILGRVNTDYYLRMSADQREIRYRAKRDTVVADQIVVAAGNATDRQFKLNAVEIQSFRAYHDMSAMLRVMQSLDPEEYANVPEIFKIGLKHQRLSNARQQGNTVEKIQGRLERFTSEDMAFAPYSDNIMDAILAPLIERVTAIMRENLASIGFSMLDGPAFVREMARWASSLKWANPSFPPAITSRDGVPIETWEDLESMGFQVSVASCIFTHLCNISCTPFSLNSKVEILHSSRFAYNCRVLETRLHRKF
jgi:hypothetical protein